MKTALIAFIVAIALPATGANAADRIRIAAQATGTLAWELKILRDHGLDKKADLDIQTTVLASTEAGKVAIEGRSADMILSDWLWVARERALGDDLVFFPYSSTLGGVMVPNNSSIRAVTDLPGKKLGVAGGPLDKSWLLLQALGRRHGLDLKRQSQIAYGAPSLLAQKALQGETDATLTYWNFCAELEAGGMKQILPMEGVMKELGTNGAVSMIGYVFKQSWAEQNRSLLARFFTASHEAKAILAASPAEWQQLAPQIGASEPAALSIYRALYLQGLPRRPLKDEIADAQTLYRVLAEVGGSDLVGPAATLDPATFYTAGTVE